MRRNAARGTHDIRTNFDSAFYRRFYHDPRTRVHSAAEIQRLATFVFAYLDYLRVPVRRVLDLGCGVGRWQREVATHHPRATYTGVETSEYLREKYGWDRGSVTDYRGRGRYDLVICQSVLQYLEDADAHRAIANIARLCRGALYLEAPTRDDLQRNADRATTDRNIHRRTAAWYRAIIQSHFRAIGGGVFLPLDSPVVLYELEGLEPRK
jgi:trans-aconitate methyltransferase